MKQLFFLSALLLVGTVGVFFNGPFIALWVYYLFSVLRPQFLWRWAIPEVAWSSYVALAAIAATMAYLIKLYPFYKDDEPAFMGMSAAQKLYLAFCGWVLLSYFTAQDQRVAGIWAQEYLKIFLMFMIGIWIVRRTKQVWYLYVGATVALGYIAYEINSVYIFNGRLDIYHWGYGGLDNNGAGLMLAMAVPLSVYAWEASRKWWRWIFAGFIPFLVHAVLMSYSRGAMLALIVALPVVIMRSQRRRQFSLIALAMACALPIMAGPEIRARFMTVNRYEADASANSRFQSWGAAIRMANDYPLLGVGIRNSNRLSYTYGADSQGRTIHSQYFQLMADSGYPAVTLYVLATIALLVGGVRARSRLKDRTDDEAHLMRSMLSGLESAIIIFAFGSIFLSLEVFELPYLIALLAGQLAMITKTATAPAAAVTAAAPAPAVVGWQMPPPSVARPRLATKTP